MDIWPDAKIIIGTRDPFQNESKLTETFCSFAKIEYETGYMGKLDFIRAHAGEEVFFMQEGILLGEGLRDVYPPEADEILFGRLLTDDGTALIEVDELGGFKGPDDKFTGVSVRIAGGRQRLMCFWAGKGVKYPEFLTGDNGEGVTICDTNRTAVEPFSYRYLGDPNLKLSQMGMCVLIKGAMSRGLWTEDNPTYQRIKEVIPENIFPLAEAGAKLL